MNTDINKTENVPEVTVTKQSEAATEKPERRFSVYESVFAWFCIIAGYFFCRTMPINEKPLAGLIFTAVLFAVTAAVLVIRKRRIGFVAWISAVFALFVCSVLIFTSNMSLQIIAYSYAMLTYIYFIYSAAGSGLEKGASDLIALDYILAVMVMPFLSLADIFKAMFKSKLKLNAWTLLKIILGICCAVIPTGVICMILSYDSGFVDLFERIFDFNSSEMASRVISLIFALPIGMCIFGLYESSVSEKRQKIVTTENCYEISSAVKKLPRLSLVTAVIPIFFVYVIFFISQKDYYISAFTKILPEGLSYAEYARSGFFQLCTVSAINLLIIVCASLFVRRNGTKPSGALRAVSAIFSVFTLILIGTALAKMLMYIDAYGLTRLRVYATFAICLLALIFVLVGLSAIFVKLKTVFISAVICAVCFTAFGAVDIDAVIANYNADAFISGELQNFDVSLVKRLGDSGIPALVRISDEWDDRKSTGDLVNVGYDGDIRYVVKIERLREYLADRKSYYKTERNGFFETTLPLIKAKQALNGFDVKEADRK